MVKKLLKHELFALFRVLVFFMAAVLIFSALGRIMIGVEISNMEAAGETTTALFIISILFYVCAIYALIIGAYALACKRFYDTLFTGEGYLTLSIPATPMQLIWSKIIASLIGIFSATVVSVLSLFIFTAGISNEDIMNKVFNILGEELRAMFEMFEMGTAESVIYIIEGVVEAIVQLPMFLLIAFSVLASGQFFTSHRKGMTSLMAVLVIIVISLLDTLVITPIGTSLVMISPHLEVWISIALSLGIDVGCTFFIRYILKNKINLIA